MSQTNIETREFTNMMEMKENFDSPTGHPKLPLSYINNRSQVMIIAHQIQINHMLNAIEQGYDSSASTLSSLPEMASQGIPDIAAGETGRIWGDPHFVGGDGGKFDVQGEANKTYNLLNDTGLILNGKFSPWGKGKTVVGESGLTLSGPKGASKITFSSRPNPKATINGRTVKPGETIPTADGGSLSLSPDGKTLTVKTAEGYTLTQKVEKSGPMGHLEILVSTPSNGVATEGRLPGGLLGQSFDKDKLARNSKDKQGAGAIEGSYKNYEVPGGVFGTPSPDVAPQAGNLEPFFQLLRRMGIEPASQYNFPKENPMTLNPINWGQEIGKTLLDGMYRSALRKDKAEISENEQKLNRLSHLMEVALTSGNIALAMMIFSHLEARSANELTQTLVKKVRSLQDEKRKVSKEIQGLKNDEEGNKQMMSMKTKMEGFNDDISVLQTFIRDVAQNKQQSIELANTFLSREHETTMRVVRS